MWLFWVFQTQPWTVCTYSTRRVWEQLEAVDFFYCMRWIMKAGFCPNRHNRQRQWLISTYSSLSWPAGGAAAVGSGTGLMSKRSGGLCVIAGPGCPVPSTWCWVTDRQVALEQRDSNQPVKETVLKLSENTTNMALWKNSIWHLTLQILQFGQILWCPPTPGILQPF